MTVRARQLESSDRSALAAVCEPLETLNLSRSDTWKPVVAPLGELLRGEALIYGVSTSTDIPRIAFVESPRLLVSTTAREMIDASYARQGGFGLYRALDVAPGQRNRAVVLADLTTDRRKVMRPFQPIGYGRCDQVRVLVCDGSTMRAWFGGFRDESDPFTSREKRLLELVRPVFMRRLELESALARTRLTYAALDVALEALGRRAVIIDSRGHVQHANSLARVAYEADTTAFAAALHDARRGDRSAWDVHPLRAPGVTKYALCVGRASEQRHPLPDWNLTQRERQVLELVAQGCGNAHIGARLTCSERTVEVHVTRLLEKAGVTSRSELVARVWQCGEQ